MKLNRYTIGTVALKQETFSIRSMTEDTAGEARYHSRKFDAMIDDNVASTSTASQLLLVFAGKVSGPEKYNHCHSPDYE